MAEPGRKSLDLRTCADLGLRLAITILLFTYVGYRCDLWLDTTPWLLVTGSVLGLSIGMYHAIRTVDAALRGREGGGDEAP